MLHFWQKYDCRAAIEHRSPYNCVCVEGVCEAKLLFPCFKAALYLHMRVYTAMYSSKSV